MNDKFVIDRERKLIKPKYIVIQQSKLGKTQNWWKFDGIDHATMFVKLLQIEQKYAGLCNRSNSNKRR